jgi:hypothetical protein
MPSKIKGCSVEQYPQVQLEELTALSNEIDEHVAKERWEQLVVALDLRQQCLESLFSEAVVEFEALKSLASSILQQDAVFVARIQEQRKIVEKQIIALDKGRRAIQAYVSS